MAMTLKELRGLSDDDLVAQHDEIAGSTVVGLNYYLAEIARRDQDRQTQAMLSYTKWVTIMTAIITVATIANIWL